MLSKLGRCGESSDRHAVCRTDQAILAFACAASAAFPIERPVEQSRAALWSSQLLERSGVSFALKHPSSHRGSYWSHRLRPKNCASRAPKLGIRISSGRTAGNDA